MLHRVFFNCTCILTIIYCCIICYDFQRKITCDFFWNSHFSSAVYFYILTSRGPTFYLFSYNHYPHVLRDSVPLIKEITLFWKFLGLPMTTGCSYVRNMIPGFWYATLDYEYCLYITYQCSFVTAFENMLQKFSHLRSLTAII